MCGGILDDYRRRLPHYYSDIADGLTCKTVSAALFMFFATFCSTVALGAVISDNTKCDNAQAGANCEKGSSYLGVTEYLLINCVAGMLHSVLGCQALLVLRPTGPITAFLSILFNISVSFNLDFRRYLALTGIFVSLYMTIIASFEVSRLIRHLTRFLHEIFAFFVSEGPSRTHAAVPTSHSCTRYARTHAAVTKPARFAASTSRTGSPGRWGASRT
jgi:hypothetical protein